MLLVAACGLPEFDPARYTAPAPGAVWTPAPEQFRQHPPVAKLPGIPPELAPTAERLTLPQLLDVALHTNPTTRQKWQQARAAAAAWAAARGAYYPALRGVLIGSYYDVGPSVGTLSFRGPVGVERATLSYLLLDFGGRSGRAEAAREVLLAANWNHDQAIQDVVRNVAQAFYAYLGSKARLEADEASLGEAATSLQATEARREAGEGTKVEVLQAKAQYEQARGTVAGDRGAVKTARGNLATAVGWPANTAFDVSETLQGLPLDTLEEDVDAFIELAREHRPDLAAVRASVRQMEAELREAEAARWPQLKLVADVGGEQLGGDVDRDNFNYHSRMEVRVPLFEGFAIANNVRQAYANLEATRAALQIQEEVVISDVWTAYYQFHSGGAQLGAAEAALASAAESFAGSLERYRDGATDIVELVQAQSTLAGSRAQVVEARTSLYDAYAELVHAIGTGPAVTPAAPGP